MARKSIFTNIFSALHVRKLGKRLGIKSHNTNGYCNNGNLRMLDYQLNVVKVLRMMYCLKNPFNLHNKLLISN